MAIREALAMGRGGLDYVQAITVRNEIKSAHYGIAGVEQPPDLKVTAGSGLASNIAAGTAIVAGTEAADQGFYKVISTAVESRTHTTPNGSNHRNDIVGMRVDDQDYSASSDLENLVIVAGTPAASPVDPAIPYPNFLPLARVRVPAGAASAAAFTYTDLRALTLPGLAPLGEVAYAQFNQDTGTITTLTTVNGSVVGITAPPGRKYEAIARLNWRSSVGFDTITVHFRDNGGNIHGADSAEIISVAQDREWIVSTRFAPDPGGHFIDMTVARNTGTGLPRIQGVGSFIWVKDIGGRLV